MIEPVHTLAAATSMSLGIQALTAVTPILIAAAMLDDLAPDSSNLIDERIA